jgi:phosphoserine phosphatase
MTIYFIRHGETDLNRQNIVQGSGMDSDLNDLGRAQAKAFYDTYQHVDFELVVTSALKRTHQTVHHFLQDGIKWHQTPDINEISWGTHEGATPTPERYRDFQALLEAWRQGNYEAALPEGESARQLADRIDRFLEWVRQRPEKRILVATHGRTLRAMITRLKGIALMDMEGVPHVNTGCYIVRFENDGVVFELENDVQHLEGVDVLT